MSLRTTTAGRKTKKMTRVDITLRRDDAESYFEQLKAQFISQIYFGQIGARDRLPSARGLARQVGVNPKTIEKIYRKLRDEGYLEIKPRSGVTVKAHVKTSSGTGLATLHLRFVRKTMQEAKRLGLSPARFAELVHQQGDRSRRKNLSVVVVECNREQILGFARQIERTLRIRAHPVLLAELDRPTDDVLRKIGDARYFATTHYHWDEVCGHAKVFGCPVVEIRLNPRFFDPVIARAREGPVGVVAADRSFVNGFRVALERQAGEVRADRVRAVQVDDRHAVRELLEQVETAFVSPVHLERLEALRSGCTAQIVPFDDMIAQESLDMMEASLVAG